jgi:hypothetical protein
LVLLLLTAVIVYVETKYPRRSVPWRLRHYTGGDSLLGIVTSKVLWQTIGGTFGNGVYFASADAEDARGAGCPPNALEIATRFQIYPPPRGPDPTRTTNYIEVKITRNNLYEFGGGVNSSGGEEIVIRAPLLPTGVKDRDGNSVKGLYFGTYALGIEQGAVCAN